MDGRLTGLENVPKADLSEVGSYNGIEPFAADGDMWATWDDKSLYVSAVVRESDHRTARKIAWLPAGDSIGIGVQPGEPGEGPGAWGAHWYMLYAGDTVAEGRVYSLNPCRRTVRWGPRRAPTSGSPAASGPGRRPA
ncbi:hypothetical protein [Streptomyces sp. NPDC002403]